MAKYKARIDLVVEADSPKDAAQKFVDKLMSEKLLDVEIYGYMFGKIRTYIDNHTVLVRENLKPGICACSKVKKKK